MLQKLSVVGFQHCHDLERQSRSPNSRDVCHHIMPERPYLDIYPLRKSAMLNFSSPKNPRKACQKLTQNNRYDHTHARTNHTNSEPSAVRACREKYISEICHHDLYLVGQGH